GGRCHHDARHFRLRAPGHRRRRARGGDVPPDRDSAALRGTAPVLGHRAAGGALLAAGGGTRARGCAMVVQSLGAWAPAIVTFAAVMLGTLALALLWEWWAERGRRRDVVEQLRSFAARSGGDQASRTLIRGVKTGEAPWLQPVAAGLPQLRDLADALAQAGMRWSARSYFLMTLAVAGGLGLTAFLVLRDRKSTRLNSSHVSISYAVFCLKKKT